MPIDAETEVTAVELGLLFGVSRKRVEQMATKGLVVRIGKGRFALVESVTRHREVTLKRLADGFAAKASHRDLKSEELELRIGERTKALVAEAQAETLRIVDEICGPLKSDLMALPARVTADIALRRKIESGIDEAFNSAANRAEDAAGRIPSGHATLAVAATNNARSLGRDKPGVSGKRRRARQA